MDFNRAVSILVNAIMDKRKVNVRFYSKEDGNEHQRKCAPLDVGPSRRAKIKNDRFHFWDYDSNDGPHVLSLNPEQVIEISTLEEEFGPESIVSWDTNKTPWFIKRDWGARS
jgi:hypothetical protein